jgi:heme/copper-type cytochrome/quinol oxidase subunit 2
MKRTTLRRAAVLWAFPCAVVAGIASAYVVSGFSGERTRPDAGGRSESLHEDGFAQNQAPTVRPWLVKASRYEFSPPRIEVLQDDVVKIELRTEDIAHSLTIDAYRIAKRVNPGQPITFEFRADQPGTFLFYCNLQIDDGCRRMHGELVVKARK